MITDNYIKMCEQAEEIQKAWEPKAGDYTQLKNNRQIYLISSVEKSKDKKKVVFYTNIINGNDSWCYLEFFKDNFIYLPTLEQLWKEVEEQHFTENTDLTIGNNLKTDMYYVSTYTDIDDNIYTRKAEGKTLKECLLKLIMIEHCKAWTGEKWVKADD